MDATHHYGYTFGFENSRNFVSAGGLGGESSDPDEIRALYIFVIDRADIFRR